MSTHTTAVSANVRLKLWMALTGLGAVGLVLSLPALMQLMQPLIAKANLSQSAAAAATVFNGLVQIAIVVGAGTWAAGRANLSAPVIESWVFDVPEPAGPRFVSQIPRSMLTGVIAAISAIALNVLFSPVLPEAFRTTAVSLHGASRLRAFLTAVSTLFYGGLVEELLMRWGVLSLLLVVALKLFSRGKALVLANLTTSFFFGVGHLPAGLQLGASGLTLVYLVLGNMTPGLLFGWLFYRRGLEQAMVAHACADFFLHALPVLFL